MNIKLIYDSLFFDVTRRHEEVVTVETATVNNLIDLLSQRYGQAFRNTIIDTHTHSPNPQATVLVNGRHQTWDAPIPDRAEVAFLVPIAGGSQVPTSRNATRLIGSQTGTSVPPFVPPGEGETCKEVSFDCTHKSS